jgi:hypothetical protein
MARLILFSLLICFVFSCSSPSLYFSGNLAEDIPVVNAGNLAEIFQDLDIKPEYTLFIARDGTAFLISEKSFSHVYLQKDKNGFHSRSEVLPPVCNLNDLKEISLFVSNFNIKDGKTPFNEKIDRFDFLGENSRNGHWVRKYKLR